MSKYLRFTKPKHELSILHLVAHMGALDRPPAPTQTQPSTNFLQAIEIPLVNRVRVSENGANLVADLVLQVLSPSFFIRI